MSNMFFFLYVFIILCFPMYRVQGSELKLDDKEEQATAPTILVSKHPSNWVAIKAFNSILINRMALEADVYHIPQDISRLITCYIMNRFKSINELKESKELDDGQYRQQFILDNRNLYRTIHALKWDLESIEIYSCYAPSAKVVISPSKQTKLTLRYCELGELVINKGDLGMVDMRNVKFESLIFSNNILWKSIRLSDFSIDKFIFTPLKQKAYCPQERRLVLKDGYIDKVFQIGFPSPIDVYYYYHLCFQSTNVNLGQNCMINIGLGVDILSAGSYFSNADVLKKAFLRHKSGYCYGCCACFDGTIRYIGEMFCTITKHDYTNRYWLAKGGIAEGCVNCCCRYGLCLCSCTCIACFSICKVGISYLANCLCGGYL